VVAKAEAKSGEKEADSKNGKPSATVASDKEQSSGNSKGPNERTPKNGSMSALPPVDASAEPLLEQDVQLQKAVEMLKTWKIFKELRPS
jgi:carboxyl-terminal processing protease